MRQRKAASAVCRALNGNMTPKNSIEGKYVTEGYYIKQKEEMFNPADKRRLMGNIPRSGKKGEDVS